MFYAISWFLGLTVLAAWSAFVWLLQPLPSSALTTLVRRGTAQ